MAFCPNCGAAVDGRFCAKCGTAIAETGSSASSTTGTQQQYTPPPGAQPYGGQQYTPPGAEPYQAPQSTGMSQNVAGALAYILGLITGIVFLVLAPYNQNKFVRFHAFQSIFLHVAWIVLWIIDTIITTMLPWSLMIISSLLWLVIALGGLAVWIFCMVKAYNNEMFKLPVIGDIAAKQA
jgi:uncharacterized membrane protein